MIVAGGRNYKPNASDEQRITDAIRCLGVDEIVSGGAGGADAMGENYAKATGTRLSVFPANWKMLGRQAGPSRNEEMAKYADALLYFPGGAGTKDMIKRAYHHSLKVLAAYPVGEED
jgi:hypothetical protein